MFPELASLSSLNQHPDFSREHQRKNRILFGGIKRENDGLGYLPGVNLCN